MIRNTTALWGWPAKLLHWIAALAILLLLGHGWWMTHLAARPGRIAHYNGHAALGYDLLALLVLRLLWRWANPVPVLPDGLRPGSGCPRVPAILAFTCSCSLPR
jgi:cytochrome b561